VRQFRKSQSELVISILSRQATRITGQYISVDASLLYAILVSYFLTPEAVPGTFVVPLRGGFEITAARRQVLANYVFV
jgi:hypothetical protein